MRPILAEAVDLARRALRDLEPAGVGVHLGVTAEDDASATHHFEATLPGYRGWQWAVVVAAPPEADRATVSESALLPGPDALVAPDFIPWDQRVRPGDLAPGDLLAPPADDPRLVPGYMATGDPAVDDVALELGLGRSRLLSREGREEAADRWFSEFGPDTDMARAAPSTCGLCGFYVPLAGALRAAFGVCANAMGADGHVVHAEYGCGAHSDTELPTGGGSPIYEAFDDAAVELIPESELRKADDSANTIAPEADSTTTQAAVAEDAVADADTADVSGSAKADSDHAAAVVADVAVTAPESVDAPAEAETEADIVTAQPESVSDGEPEFPTPSAADFVAPVVGPESVEAESQVDDNPDIPATAEFVAPVVDHVGDESSLPAEERDSAPLAADTEPLPAGEPEYPTPGAADFVAPVVSPESVEAEALVEDDPEVPATAEFVAPVVDHVGDAASVSAEEGNPAPAAGEVGPITLFDVDPDAGPYDDAWGVAAVKVDPKTGEPGSGSN